MPYTRPLSNPSVACLWSCAGACVTGHHAHTLVLVSYLASFLELGSSTSRCLTLRRKYPLDRQLNHPALFWLLICAVFSVSRSRSSSVGRRFSHRAVMVFHSAKGASARRADHQASDRCLFGRGGRGGVGVWDLCPSSLMHYFFPHVYNFL